PLKSIISTIYRVILCTLLPPVAVWLHGGECSLHVLLTLILWIAFIIPGVLYALWFCFFRTLFINRSKTNSSDAKVTVDRNVYF
ncbi:hypothetical protein PENTCL1PPCAC_23098, partial [Pristionchus entomophagus]